MGYFANKLREHREEKEAKTLEQQRKAAERQRLIDEQNPWSHAFAEKARREEYVRLCGPIVENDPDERERGEDGCVWLQFDARRADKSAPSTPWRPIGMPGESYRCLQFQGGPSAEQISDREFRYKLEHFQMFHDQLMESSSTYREDNRKAREIYLEQSGDRDKQDKALGSLFKVMYAEVRPIRDAEKKCWSEGFRKAHDEGNGADWIWEHRNDPGRRL